MLDMTEGRYNFASFKPYWHSPRLCLNRPSGTCTLFFYLRSACLQYCLGALVVSQGSAFWFDGFELKREWSGMKREYYLERRWTPIHPWHKTDAMDHERSSKLSGWWDDKGAVPTSWGERPAGEGTLILNLTGKWSEISVSYFSDWDRKANRRWSDPKCDLDDMLVCPHIELARVTECRY